LIVNRLRPEMVRSGDMLSVEDVCEVLAVELLGVVPDDERSSTPPIAASRSY